MRYHAFAVSLLASYFATSAVTAADCRGIWSARGQQPHVGDSFTSDAVPSPDKNYTLTISEDAVVFIGSGAKQTKLDVPVNTALMEIVWSQDSKSFAINESDATNDGPWQTYLYRVQGESDTPRRIAIDAAVEKSAAQLPRCDAKVPTNIAVIAWTENDTQAIVVAETPVLEVCKNNKGGFVGFRLSADTGKLLESLPQSSLRERWPGALGCRLRKN